MPTLSAGPTRTTLLAILQQSEYDFSYFDQWYLAHQHDEVPVTPKEWTPKLQLIANLSQLWPFLPLPQQIKWATWLVQPGEWLTRQITYQLAQWQLQAAKRRGLIVIAFAGSYGKTSTKKITEHVLSQFQSTLATPKSINTPLGIARFIRKNLTSNHRYFLVELGEYYPGDITALCEFIQPQYGVVCPAGRQHLERMGDLETIARTVLELAEYIKPKSRVLIHESLQPYLTDLKTWQWYGQSADCQWRLTAAKVSRAGTEGDITLGTETRHVFTPLFGAHQLLNSLPSLWLAQTLGLEVPNAIKRLGSTPYIPHRHQPMFVDNNVLILDNGYNSNPDSAIHSLQLLSSLPASHRLVITPGFVELGAAADQLHEEFGRQLAKHCNYVGLIQSAGSAAIQQGWLAAGGARDKIITAQSQEEAVTKLQAFITPNSIILFENSNLPAVYK